MVRLKHRYLLSEVIFLDKKVDDSLRSSDIVRALKEVVAYAHGDYGLACVVASLQVKYFNPQTCVTLVRVSRDHYDKLWSAMALMTSLKKRECIFRVIHLAGTIKSCQKKLLLYNQAQLRVLAEEAVTAAERQRIEQLMADAGTIPR